MCVEGSNIAEGEKLDGNELPEDAESCRTCSGLGGLFSRFLAFGVDCRPM